MDRLDCRVTELREEYLRVVDSKPAISEQIENLLQHIESKFAKKSALTASIDNLGEEIASDINSFESQLRLESDRVASMAQSVATFQNDLKIC